MADTISYDASYNRAGGLQSPAGGFISATFDATVQNMGIADVWQALSIPAGMMVHDVGVAVLVAEGETAKLDVGDSAVADGYIDNLDLEALGTGAVGMVSSWNNASEYAGGKYYATADTIDCTFTTATEDCKFVIFAHVSKPRV